MSKIRKFAVAAAVVVATIGGSLTIAAPASAATPNCSPGAACVYEHANYGGQRFNIPPASYGTGWMWTYADFWNDQISSYSNKNSRNYYGYEHSGTNKGRVLTINAGVSYSNLALIPAWNDQVSGILGSKI